MPAKQRMLADAGGSAIGPAHSPSRQRHGRRPAWRPRMLSPVSMLSFLTAGAVGNLAIHRQVSLGRTMKMSPGTSDSAGTSIHWPSRSTRAMRGCSFTSASIAALVPALARTSRQLAHQHQRDDRRRLEIDVRSAGEHRDDGGEAPGHAGSQPPLSMLAPRQPPPLRNDFQGAIVEAPADQNCTGCRQHKLQPAWQRVSPMAPAAPNIQSICSNRGHGRYGCGTGNGATRRDNSPPCVPSPRHVNGRRRPRPIACPLPMAASSPAGSLRPTT